MSIQEGQRVAMRWLIMFVGVSSKEKKDNWAPKPYTLLDANVDVRIDRLDGGITFPLDTDDAKKLARVWKGCSQASGHPTRASEHPPVELPELAEAWLIIMNHLRSLYEFHRLNLQDIILTR